MLLTLARHGETVENKNKIVQGHWPGELTKLGREQARVMAEQLKEQHFDAIYSSDLKRSVDTAAYVATYHRTVPFYTTKGLREIYFGEFEGLPEAEVDWLKPVEDFWNYSRGGGETNAEFYTRVTRCVNEIYSRHANESVLILTHGWPIKVIMSAIENKELEKLYPEWLDNCAVLHYDMTRPLVTTPGQVLAGSV